MKQLLVVHLTLCALWMVHHGSEARSKYVSEEEDNPYEFGFTIDGQQHRHEKKDANGVIQGEFGFITADGVYHVTVYATDENGNFKILSMRNVRISGPLDEPNAQLPDTSQFSKGQPNAVAGPNPLSISTTPAPIQKLPAPIQKLPAVTESNHFTTQATIKPACAGCGYVTHKTPLNNNLPFQTAAVHNPKPGTVVIGNPQPSVPETPSFGNVPLDSHITTPQSTQQQGAFDPEVHEQPFAPPQGHPGQISKIPAVTQTNIDSNSEVVAPFVSNEPAPQQPHQGNPPGSDLPGRINTPTALQDTNLGEPMTPNQIQQHPDTNTQFVSNSAGAEPPSNYPQGDVNPNQNYPTGGAPHDTYPGTQGADNRYPQADYPQITGPQGNNPYEGDHQPQQPNGFLNPLSIGTPNQPSDVGPSGITVSNGQINVPNNPPIPIQDKFPGMIDGLPDGITQGDITDLLYKFNYTVGFHGHYEKGYKNGAKVGGYFVNDRDGVSRIVTYVADENGYRPKVKFIRLDLTSDLVPKEGTEKTFGLKNFEFVWYPLK